MVNLTGERLYERIASDLRDEIVSQRLLPGALLPSEAQLAERHGVARTTVRRAIADLTAEGLITSVAGKGHLVLVVRPLLWVASHAERNIHTDLSPSDVWSQGIRDLGRVPTEKIRVERARAQGQVADWLELEPGEPVVVRRRIRYVDDEAYQIADSYYPYSIVAGTAIEMPDDVLPGVYRVFEELGRPWDETWDRVRARAPSYDETQTLHIPRGVQVAEVIRRSYDADGVPLRLTIFVLPQDRHEIEYRMRGRDHEDHDGRKD
ncbi:MAG TPA: GntR family transcriptional regulator [Sphingobium sp.]